MGNCHGGLDTIVATVIMVVLVVLLLIMGVAGLSRDSGQTLNQSVANVTDAQNNTQVTLGTNGVIHSSDM